MLSGAVVHALDNAFSSREDGVEVLVAGSISAHLFQQIYTMREM